MNDIELSLKCLYVYACSIGHEAYVRMNLKSLFVTRYSKHHYDTLNDYTLNDHKHCVH